VKFSLQSDGALNLVRAVTPAGIRVGERLIARSAILTAERIVTDWPPRTVAELTEEHLRLVLALEPELILLGTGEQQQFPAANLQRLALDARVGLETMTTPAACRTYNVLVQEGRRVAAALLLAPLSQEANR